MRQVLVDLDQVEGIGVDDAAVPFFHFFVVGVLGIAEYFEQVVVAPDAAAVFRGAGAFAGEADEKL